MDRRIYDPLPQQPGLIRLLRLLPDGDINAPIICSLIPYSLHDLGERPHLYEAVSYVWGDPNKVTEITVSGHSVNITTNLHAVLQRLRNHYFDRILWIDALCIDQGNKDEVATQILSMSRIYGQASRVLIWLGEASHGSDALLEDIRAAGTARYDVKVPDREAMDRMFARPWFRRIWASAASKCPT